MTKNTEPKVLFSKRMWGILVDNGTLVSDEFGPELYKIRKEVTLLGNDKPIRVQVTVTKA